MGSKTPATQTVTNETKLDPTTAAWSNALFQGSTNAFNQGPAQYYPGSTVAPFSDATQAGLGMMQQQAMGGAIGLPQAYGAAMRSMSGYTPGMNTAQQASQGGMMNPFYGSIAQAGQQSVSQQLNPYFQQAINSSGNANPYAAQIAQVGQTPTTMGVDALNSFTGDQNPYLQQMYEQGREQITNDLNARFAGAGRTGANAAYGNALGNSLGQLYTGIMAPGYEAAQNRKMSAAGQLAGIGQADRGAAMAGLETAGNMAGQQTNSLLNTLGMYGDVLGQDYARNYQGASDMAGLYGMDADRRLQGAGMAGGMWSQANADASRAGNDLASFYQYGGMPAQQMLGAGGAYDAYQQQLLDADVDRWNYGQNAQWQNLERYGALMNGMPNLSSTVQTSTSPQQGNRLMSALGGGLGMYGALAMNPVTAPFALLGGGLGALTGAFG